MLVPLSLPATLSSVHLCKAQHPSVREGCGAKDSRLEEEAPVENVSHIQGN